MTKAGLFACNLTYLKKICRSPTLVDSPAKSIATRQMSVTDELIYEIMAKENTSISVVIDNHSNVKKYIECLLLHLSNQ